jgi:hypothetical protein
MTTEPRYIVMTAAACMPASCRFGRYRKVAVVKRIPGMTPTQINPRHRAVEEIVAVWDRQYAGKTDACAYATALAEAEALAAKLNDLSDEWADRLKRLAEAEALADELNEGEKN